MRALSAAEQYVGASRIRRLGSAIRRVLVQVENRLWLCPYLFVGHVRGVQLVECFGRPSLAHRVGAGVQKCARCGGDVLTVDGQLRNSYERDRCGDCLLLSPLPEE
jgi:hypothetical protein